MTATQVATVCCSVSHPVARVRRAQPTRPAVVAQALRSGRLVGVAHGVRVPADGREAVGLAFDVQSHSAVLGTELLSRSDAELTAARASTDPAERFGHAHLAALKVAGVVLEVSAAKPPRGRTRSAWERLAATGAEFSAWAAFFAAGASLRLAIDAGRFDAVDQERADCWVQAAEDFQEAVGCWLIGLPRVGPLS